MDTAVIFKILLWILLAVILLVLAFCLLNVKMTVGNSGKFYYKIHIGGIRIRPEKFASFGKKHGEKKDKGKQKEKAAKKGSSDKKKVSAEKSGKSPGDVLGIISAVARTASEVLPKGIRIRLKYLNITAGGEDAAATAVNYGKIHAVLSGVLALFDGYRGFLYGFRYRRKNVVINADFLSGKTKADFELTVSFFVWQLLFSGIRIGISAIKAIMENAAKE